MLLYVVTRIKWGDSLNLYDRTCKFIWFAFYKYVFSKHLIKTRALTSIAEPSTKMVHRRTYSDDKSSMESVSNPGGKTHLTVFSQRQSSSILSSRSSPPQSRGQSPARSFSLRVQPQSPIFKDRQEIFPLPVSNNSLFSIDGRALSQPSEIAKMNVEQGDCSTPVGSKFVNSPTFLSLSNVGRMFDDSHSSSVRSFSDDSDDEDLDLEQDADSFLSTNFGISLSKLKRPHRIIYAFQRVRSQCADILEDEGHHFANSPCSGDGRSEPVDGEVTDHPTRGDRSNSISSTSLTLRGTKRPNQDITEIEGFFTPGSQVKTRRPKRRRTRGGFSCPYRKRNPRRFNIRDHEECANRSYKDISTLKKHITACHCKEDACLCERCNQNCQTPAALLAHLRQCPNPPPNLSPIQYTDPEDGIERGTEEMLRSRQSKSQVSDWNTLWKRLFPADKVVPCPDFEPVVEDHDLVYFYRISQSRILDHLDALTPGSNAEDIKALFIEEMENVLRCRGSQNQILTPSSSSSISMPSQSRAKNSEIVLRERESDLAANAVVSRFRTEVSNVRGLDQPTPNGTQTHFGNYYATESSLTDVIGHPITRYEAPVATDYHQNSQRPINLTLYNEGPDTLQSQIPWFSTGTNTFPQTSQDGHWTLNNGYQPTDNDPLISTLFDLPESLNHANVDF
ncbi:hypothetical protein F5Y19DRAFT_421087 [Xylariaceae sp. FL1651]|nr:hypothetical protein F5Y19DRAFT_421087 [Xylariaceae sp. FL1651]